MQDLNDKVNGGNLPASQWNQLPSEVQNVIENAGLTLSAVDLYQLLKSIYSISGYSDYYIDIGVTANLYELESPPNQYHPNVYKLGQRVRFYTTRVSTSSTVNIKIGTQPNVQITSTFGSLVVPVVGQILGFVDLVYDGTRFALSSADVQEPASITQTSYVTNDVSGDGNNISASFSPKPASVLDATTKPFICYVRAIAANTFEDPNISINGMSFEKITKGNGTRLTQGDYVSGYWMALLWDPSLLKFKLLNPLNPVTPNQNIVNVQGTMAGNVITATCQRGSLASISGTEFWNSTATVHLRITNVSENTNGEVYLDIDGNGPELITLSSSSRLPIRAVSNAGYYQLNRKRSGDILAGGFVLVNPSVGVVDAPNDFYNYVGPITNFGHTFPGDNYLSDCSEIEFNFIQIAKTSGGNSQFQLQFFDNTNVSMTVDGTTNTATIGTVVNWLPASVPLIPVIAGVTRFTCKVKMTRLTGRRWFVQTESAISNSGFIYTGLGVIESGALTTFAKIEATFAAANTFEGGVHIKAKKCGRFFS